MRALLPFATVFAMICFFCQESVAQQAYGQTTDYRNSWPSLDLWTEYTVLVGVSDKRPYILNGDKEPAFVGLSRSQLGIPYDILTTSKASLASDLEQALANGLLNSGVLAERLSQEGDREGDDAGTPVRKLILTLFEWKSDTYRDTTFHYDFELQVFTPDNRVVSSQRFASKRTDSSGIDAARMVLSAALAAPDILHALDSEFVPGEPSGAVSADSAPKLDVDGIYEDLLKLKELLDKGIITQQEFDEQKRGVLGGQ